MTDQAYTATASRIRSFVERAERLDDEKADIAQQRKEVMAEAKSDGYNVAALNKLIALRKMDAEDRAEADAILDMYSEAIGL